MKLVRRVAPKVFGIAVLMAMRRQREAMMRQLGMIECLSARCVVRACWRRYLEVCVCVCAVLPCDTPV